jgi:putative FmdB family regulatory protein
MPTYQYECQACGHSFDELQSMSDPKLRKCPKCHKIKLVRLIGGGSGMIFKGSGFYETDYKRKPAPAADSKKEPAKSDSKASAAPAGACGGSCACHPH